MKKIIGNLLKVKSIVTFTFLFITVYAVVKQIVMPEWLLPIVTLCFRELFDKDKVKSKEKEDRDE